jgi:pectate lyase
MKVCLIGALLLFACSDSSPGSSGAAAGSSGSPGAAGQGGVSGTAPIPQSGGDSGDGGSVAEGGAGSAALPLPAFPGAQGFGTATPGGRGGKVYVVTTLDWDGPGSLSEALQATEPRIVVFRVSGVIDVPGGGASMLTEENSYLTVAGQTSPGGITLRGAATTLESYQAGFHDAVFRFLRFRGQSNYDNVSFNTTHDLVFDHCDFSGGSDEAFDITFSHDFTVQWTTITNSGPEGQVYGQLLAYPPTSRISLHHNFSAHHKNRCGPHMHWGEDGAAPAEGAALDYRNNVIYDCAFEKGLDITTPASGYLAFNFVGNYAKAGPNTPNEGNTALLGIGETARLYEHDNSYEPGLPILTIYSQPELEESPFDYPEVTTEPAADAFETVLATVGAWPRDPMNERTIAEARDGTGSLSNVSDALLEAGPEAPADADLDGVSDAWEAAHELDPNDAADSALDRDGDGYSNIEEYVNELAAALIGK